MRVLFTHHPFFGHFHAMVPLALALRDYGHEVAFATGANFEPVIRHVGFPFFAAGHPSNLSPAERDSLPEAEWIRKTVSPDPIEQVNGFVLGMAPKMANDLLALTETWQPDVIVRDPIEFGGYIAAEVRGVPHASVTWAVYIPGAVLARDALLTLRRRFGLSEVPDPFTAEPYLVFDFLPPSWTPPGWPQPPVTHRYCAAPFDLSTDADVPDWVGSLPDRPTVYATLGTTFNQAPASFQAIIDAMCGEDVNLILTVGQSVDPAQFSVPGDNVHLARYIPQSQLLPRCDALLFHGGYNSLLSALWHGLPVVVMPHGAGDQEPTARRCTELGIGVRVEGHPATPQAIRAGVWAVLDQPQYRARAREMQREINALPPLSAAVQRLERMKVEG
jgi:UDP:flavonoid glycosyltransferase YjiC (YdhE family)